MEYRKIMGGGFEVYTDAYIIQPVSPAENMVFFISLVGTQTQVTAINASLFQGSTPMLVRGEEYLPLKIPRKSGMLSVGRKVNNTLHRILRAEYYFSNQKQPADAAIMESKVVYGRDLEAAKSQAFLRFDRSVSVPLLPDWIDWLWDEVFVLQRLEGFGLEEFNEAWLIGWDSEEEIQEKILNAVRDRIIH